jgi:hypothetical protein
LSTIYFNDEIYIHTNKLYKMASTFLDIKGRNLVLSGDLTVLGTSTQIDSTVVTIADPLMKLGDGNTGNVVDTGVYAEQDTGTTATYSGYFKDATDDKFRFFKDLQVEPGTTVNTAGTGYAPAGLIVESLETTNVQIDVTNGTIDTSTGALTISAASNSNVVVNPAGTGVTHFHSDATDGGYTFPTDAGAAQDTFLLSYNDTSGALEFFDPSSLGGGADHLRSDATLTTAGAIVIVESATSDRDVVESGIIIDGSDNITGIVNLTASGTVTSSTYTSTGGLAVTTAANGDITLDPNGTGQVKINNCLTYHGANNTSSDACDLGYFGVYDPTGSLDLYTGLFRDASDSGKYKLFDSLQAEPTGDLVDTAGTGFALADLAVNLVEAGNVRATGNTVDTLSGTLTISAATNNNVIIDPAGTGVVNFYGAYAFPPADGAAADYIMKTDGAGTITWVNPTTLVGADHVTASANFTNANRLVITENGGDREVVETDIVITGGNTISGVTTITANQLLDGCATQNANVTLTATDETTQAVTTAAGTIVVTLPTDPPCGTKFKILKADAGIGNVSIVRGGTNTLTDGVTTTMTLTDQFDYTTLKFEDTTGVWYIL